MKAFKLLSFILALLFSAFIGYSLSESYGNILNNDSHQNSSETVSYDHKRHLYFSPDEKYVKRIGRSVFYNDTLWMSMSGSGIEFITSSDLADISFVCNNIDALQINHRPRVIITVNGDVFFDDTLSEREQLVSLDLGKHIGDKVIRIIKLSESMYSSCGISRIYVYSDKDISPTDDNELKIEFIGDSITAGYGIDEANEYKAFSTGTENFSKTYAYLAAEKLKADYSVVAFSGYGVLSGQNKKDCIVSKYYEKAITNISFNSPYPLEKWSFNSFIPDIVVINLGVNDVSYCYTESRKADFVDEYKKLIGLVRWHNKKAHILCVLGEVNNSLYPYIEKAVEAYIEETNDFNVYCDTLDFEMRNYQSAIDGHPSEASHIAAGDKLAVMISSILNNSFINSYERNAENQFS